jgi:3-isopropylmalate/(R)-2-methylmalate dehydratase small subunit
VNPLTIITGRMVPLDRADIDTDQIMPKQFLKRIERSGFGEFLFADWRADPGFVLNDPAYDGANVLVTGPNFGSGSSREHAPWGLQQHGFDAIIAPSFADIFKSNCAKIGLLTIELPAPVCKRLVALAESDPQAQIRIDLPEQQVVTADAHEFFEIDPHAKHLLVEGLDDIATTLQHVEDIADFEAQRPSHMPATAR